MDRLVKKTLIKNEKVEADFTYFSRFLNILMILSLIKWIFLLGAISALLFFLKKGEYLNSFLNLSFIEQAPHNIETTLNNNLSLETIFSQLWILPLIILLFLIVPIVIFYYQFYLRVANRYVLTNNRIIFKRGWLSTEVESIHYNRITDVLVEQSIWDKFIFGIGHININTAGSENYEGRISNVKNPHNLKKKIYKLKQQTK